MSFKKKAQIQNTAPAPALAGGGAKPVPGDAFPSKWLWVPPVLMVAAFLVSCFTTPTTLKPLCMTLAVLAILSCVFRFSCVRDRLSLPVLGVAAWVLMNGISTLYAISGKFALSEFLKILVGFCCFLLILAWSREGRKNGRTAASILTGSITLASLFSIDMLSTHWLSGSLLSFLGTFSYDYLYVSNHAVEAGVRMNSLYENPNVFAGIAGLGVLLCLELVVTAEEKKERFFHLSCLYLNALAFLLVFSMGASGIIVFAFLAILLLERRGRKASLLLLMVETLVLALAGAFPIFLTAFDIWDGFQPVPLLCAVGGAAALCLLDRFLGQRIAGRLAQVSGKFLTLLVGLVLLLVALFAGLAVSLTGPANLAAGEGLRRAEYPDPGAYTLNIQATGDLQVTIESQNQQETMMHTGTILYSGPAQGAAFTVPEGSLVTYFNFSAAEALTLESAVLTGEGTSTTLKLNYKLLPGFIANRLQGLFANENAIQRVVFFADGMKLFRRSPVFGLGLGAFESAALGVQTFSYGTKYTHNHYVETLLTTGVIGLILFLGMLGLCGAALWKNLRRGEEANPLSPALGAALLFMMGHGAVEVDFSFSYYLPVALGVLGLICLCCGRELPVFREKEEIRNGIVAGQCILIAAFCVLLGLNMWAYNTARNNWTGDPYRSLALAAKVDFFEKNDYQLSYVVLARDVNPESNWEIYTTANEFARRLGQEDSNAMPPYLAEYYFSTNQPEEAVAVLKKYVNYVSSDSDAWQTSLDILEFSYEEYPDQCRAAALELEEMLLRWNEENMGDVILSTFNQEFLDSIRG